MDGGILPPIAGLDRIGPSIDPADSRDMARGTDEAASDGVRRPGIRRRRQEVLRVAAELFAERGFAGTSTGDIADALGIKGGSVYYYIDSKEALLFELMQDIYGLLLGELGLILEADADALEKLRRLVHLHVAGMAEHRHRGALILHETRSLSPEHREVVAGHAAAYEEGVASIVAEGQEAGLLDPGLDPRLVTKALLGAGNWINRWYREGSPWSPDDLSSQYARIFLGGLALGAVPLGDEPRKGG